jgi:iron complex outermembrane recepter protein
MAHCGEGDSMVKRPLARVLLAAAILDSCTAVGGGLAQTSQSQTPGTQNQPQAAPNAPKIELPPVKVIQGPKEKAQPKPRITQRPRSGEIAPPSADAIAAEQAPTEPTQAIPMSPVKGSEIPLDKVPGAASVITSGAIARSGSPAIQDAIQQNVPGVIMSDVSGNPFSTDIQYRGFTASPVEGTPQGLAVYQNGVRINEVFGDTVNWDLIPSSAIKSIAVVSGNPLYGLNALGGAINVTMKDGFGFQGIESDTRGGSYGRIQESLQFGKQVDNFAAYLGIEAIRDDGWRQFSPSDVKRMYADLGVKGKDSEIHINFTGAETAVGAVGPTPVELLSQNYNSVYTNPQTTNNQLAMLSINGTTKLSDTWSGSGVTYLRSFHQRHVDANVSDVGNCAVLNNKPFDPTLPLCLQTADGSIVPVSDQRGKIVPTSQFGQNDTIGEIDRTSNDTNSYGLSLQATNKDTLFGFKNLFIAGASYDHGDVKTTSKAELGTLDTSNLVINGNGVFLNSPLDIAPVDLKTTTNYYGLFFTDTFDATDRLALTVGGRYNYEAISLLDLTGGNLTGDHVFARFNPLAGATYKINSNLSLYGGYSEASRAPTPAELGCADPNQPCLLASFLVSDPSLKQVVSKTWQGGLRGDFSPFGRGNLNWTAGVFRTQNFNDIMIAISPQIPTRGFFQNIGDTQRQGVEASATYKLDRLTLNANYAYVDATFLNSVTLSSPNNPFADDDGNIFVRPGDHIPSIPAHRLKAGFDYALTDAWSVGVNAVLASSQYYFGDASNQNPKLPGYGVVNLRTSYEVTKGVTIYGLINNLFDHKYATYGTFYDTDIKTVSGDPSTSLSNPAMVTPAQPFSVYAGVKVRF